MLLVEKFAGNKEKLKRFLIQVRIKIINKGLGLPILIEQVGYAGLFLTEKALKWFKLYLTKIQENGMIITNLKAKYIFMSWEGFCNQLI